MVLHRKSILEHESAILQDVAIHRKRKLKNLDKEKKKQLIRLICKVKGEKVYDEEKQLGDTYIKLEDAELVINEVLGKIRVENTNVV